VGGYRTDIPTRDGSYRTGIPPRDSTYRSDDRSTSDYRYRSERRTYDRYSRDGEMRVLVNDRPVRFSTARPFRSGSQVMVPVAPVMNAAGLDFRYDSYDRELTMTRPREVRLAVGSSTALVDGRRVSLGAPARIIDGSLYVPADFFRHAADMEMRWDQTDGTLILTEAR
jgi:hypothetical protein